MPNIELQEEALENQRISEMRRKKINWIPNDVFAIPLKDGQYAIGHILDQRMVNTVRIALYSENMLLQRPVMFI